MRTLTRYILAAALVAATLGLAAPNARADDAASFEVIVIKATKGGNNVDPALAPYKGLLGGKGYTSFEKLKDAALTLAKGATGAVAIAGGLKAEITYTSEINSRVVFKCTVKSNNDIKASVGYSLPRGGKTLVVVPLGDIGYMLLIKVK